MECTYKINQSVEYKNPRISKPMYCWVTAINDPKEGETEPTLDLQNMDTGYYIQHVPLKFVSPVEEKEDEGGGQG